MKKEITRERLMELSLNEIAEGKKPEPLNSGWSATEDEWRCPDCGNGFGYTDGVRYLTKDRQCSCGSMPISIRNKRKANGRKEQA